ncbi:MAG: N-acetylmuramoyl-L-alanine amidase [Cyanobacteria bacterium]|nr:N-acetylmuramoyl-L-alanine amidase [Cyanobacteria bacterium CG_2015-16_32_12]NCO77884.1 N-acetylmuramoyl-L-alanine amidase [Cyanobacteria bacterium CG_2015-22_32_23]NCQ03053.1 N-acetylmuramoyl-L-alanine amidase [Cyanobacteria bacterium CG_2015-09_32_10]NCQ41982.1 N-acetylmuramoyl-L-alanine amidase [Cyanobacteria bacterium CG_2015-04_32_10]NCS84010.1 N-acetylmuramoyl-L-alanine amidase [Cyanobacteria bacterium CG_2015-02_32_10]
MVKSNFWQRVILTFSFTLITKSAYGEGLKIVYPPANHETTADSIFIIGSVKGEGNVIINNKEILRSPQGNFAPSFPLQMGNNELVIRYGKEEIRRIITKISTQPDIKDILSLSPRFLSPQVDLSRLPKELVCFEAISPQNAQVKVKLGEKILNLTPELAITDLPSNSAILIGENQGKNITPQSWQKVKGCTNFEDIDSKITPVFVMNNEGKTITQESTGNISILDPQNLTVIEVITEQGIARTGAGSDYSRLTPLPKGTKAMVTGKEGDWLRLDYGGWIKAEETKILPPNVPPISIIRSINSRQVGNKTEVIFPLQNPVPIAIKQTDQTFTLSLYNTTAQTDTIRFDDNPLIKRLDWYQINPSQIDYIFNFKSARQWGYDVRYQGNNLILTFNHPPALTNSHNLDGVTILLDPGHGGDELGALGATGFPEKDVNLKVSQLLAQQLKSRGAKVYLTRDRDIFVSLSDRQKMIQELKPTLAFSIHYNALPDGGNPETTKGVSTFWYHPQAQDLAIFMQNYLVKTLNRPNYGVFWNNLALTRPNTSLSVLLELGFMINPYEFEWITNSESQEKLAKTLADGITAWIHNNQ